MTIARAFDLESEAAHDARSASGLLRVAVILVAWACGGGAGGIADPLPPPVDTVALRASLTVFVADESNDAAISGAVVAVDNVTATTAQNGLITLSSVPVGARRVTVNAPGFDPWTGNIPIVAGLNSRTLLLARVNTFIEDGNTLLYLTPDIAAFRGVFVVLYGNTNDSRPLLRGDLAFYRSFPFSGDVDGYRRSLRSFARQNGFALLGMKTPPPGTGGVALRDDILQALVAASKASSRAELPDAPLLLEGLSLGACQLYEVAGLIPDRVIGFIAMKAAFSGGTTCSFPEPTAALSVPGYFFIGELDSPEISASVTTAFERERARGAIWALAIERNAGHAWVGHHSQIFNWAGVVVSRRLPAVATPGVPAALRPMGEGGGWLGDRGSFSVAGYPCFTGDKSRASWLPSEQTAREWQGMMGGTTVLAC